MYLNKQTQLIFNKIPDMKVIYCLLTGLSYNQIGKKFYHYNTGKFVYKVRKLLKQFNLTNRRHLTYFAVKNELINPLILERYTNA